MGLEMHAECLLDLKGRIIDKLFTVQIYTASKNKKL